MEKIQKEIELGRVVGPFSELPISNLHLSPVGIIPKSDGGWRMITHLSYPESNSINDYIDPELCTVNYSSFDKVVDMISVLGKGALLGKVDVKSAFRLIPIYPGDFDLLGFSEDGLYYIDKCLPMGCAISCKIWETFATFLHWLPEFRTGLETLDHYLDDFIFAGKGGTSECSRLMENFKSVTTDIGVPLAEDKTAGPTTNITYLGLEIDTIEMVIRIPQPKVVMLTDMIKDMLGKKKVTLRDLQSLVGMLNFFGKAIRSSRAFNRRFYDAMSGASKPHHYIRISIGMRSDLEMWLKFLQKFNGVSYFPESEWTNSNVLEFFTDSAGANKLGCGAYFKGSWTFLAWPGEWKDQDIMRDITFLELVPVVLSIEIWGSCLQNKKVLFHIDNIGLVSVINKQTSKSKRTMELVRYFVLKLMNYNVIFKAKHIPGVFNSIADAISRKQWRHFRDLAPNAKETPQNIPEEFVRMIYSLK
ncbi:uncharacterized protein LOC134240321 isoform X1 [Saccostrea cucullata]|uniref:uncharacterized protein LOC134240321 isoform X1 n=1 Tax=Saccostrea cuccullata TaxID=36930 RepID=UPI002ED17257